MIRFTIPAMPWTSEKTGKERLVIDGYYAQGKRPNKARLWRYVAWKMHVQECAAEVGLDLPLRPTKDRPIYVASIAFFQSGIHPDPENVLKGIIDALCYVGKEEQRLLRAKRGSDKHVGGAFQSPKYDSENPRVEVRIASEFGYLMAWLGSAGQDVAWRDGAGQGRDDSQTLSHLREALGCTEEEEL